MYASTLTVYTTSYTPEKITGTAPDSLDRLSEINKEGGTETDSTFEVECKDFSSVEFMDLLDSLQLNDKEQVAVNILMAGGAKGEIAKALNITNATVSWHIKNLKKKFILAGYQYAV